jgi:hypothetical protein
VPTFVVSRGQRGGSPTVVNLSFLDLSRYFSFWPQYCHSSCPRSRRPNGFLSTRCITDIMYSFLAAPTCGTGPSHPVLSPYSYLLHIMKAFNVHSLPSNFEIVRQIKIRWLLGLMRTIPTERPSRPRKIMPTFAGRGRCVVSAVDPHGR